MSTFYFISPADIMIVLVPPSICVSFFHWIYWQTRETHHKFIHCYRISLTWGTTQFATVYKKQLPRYNKRYLIVSHTGYIVQRSTIVDIQLSIVFLSDHKLKLCVLFLCIYLLIMFNPCNVSALIKRVELYFYNKKCMPGINLTCKCWYQIRHQDFLLFPLENLRFYYPSKRGNQL